MPERMPVINGILNRCRRGLPFRARASTSSGAMRTAQGLEVEGDGGTSSVSPRLKWEGFEDILGWRGRDEAEILFLHVPLDVN
jgi:hypothetical protein